MTALGATLNPPKVSAQVGRDLDLDVTAHTLSGAYGAELDVTVKSIENGANLYKQGVTGSTDDLNSRVASHVVTTHVRVDSLRLLQLSTMSSVLARSQTPWKPFDPYIEIPILDLIVKRPRDAKEVFTRSLVFLDAMVVPTAADLGNGVPIIYDLAKTTGSSYKELHDLTLKRFFNEGLDRNLPQYHRAITDCLSREYLGMDGQVHVAIGPDGRSSGPSCQFKTDTSEKLMGSDSRSLIDPNPLRQDYYNTVE
jgi:hypothetical protein